MGGASCAMLSVSRTLQPSSLWLTFMATLAQSARAACAHSQRVRADLLATCAGCCRWACRLRGSGSERAHRSVCPGPLPLTLGAAAGGEADARLLGHHALGGHPQHRVARLLHLPVQLLAYGVGGWVAWLGPLLGNVVDAPGSWSCFSSRWQAEVRGQACTVGITSVPGAPSTRPNGPPEHLPSKAPAPQAHQCLAAPPGRAGRGR